MLILVTKYKHTCPLISSNLDSYWEWGHQKKICMRKRLLSFLSSNQILTIFVLATFCTVHSGFSQDQVYADQVLSAVNVDDAANAIDPSDTYATLNSYGGVAVGIGGYNGELGLEFPSLLPANTTTYVKIDFEEDVLNSLLGGNLGDLLANVLGTVVLGNHYFEIEARNGGTTVFSRSSMTASEHEDFRIVMDSEGNYYAAITPDQSYNRIYITDKTSALLLGTSNDMKVYNAFYFTDNNCAKDPLYTDFDGEGLTLDILSLGGAGVTNPENALNDDPNSYSELSIGVLGVAASIQQNIYFPNVYTPQDTFTVTLKTDPTLVTLGLLNMVSVLAYENEQIVYQTDLSSVLNLDLLTLLQNGELAEIPFAPGVGFDKVAIRLSTLVSVNVAQSLDVYAISIEDTPTPTTDSASQEFCAVDAPTVSDIDVNESGVIWYDVADGGTALAVDEPLVDGGEYYGTLVGPNGCESATRLQVTVALNDTAAPTTDNAVQEFCAVDAPTVSDIDVNESGVVWYDVADGGTAL
ncbi:MAG: hypothetical protein CMH46_07835, partial [Muricauda sp.]|nr:hypothetical protein [Allomuricauda sp.]